MNTTGVVVATPSLSTSEASQLARLGEWFKSHRSVILAAQWAMLLVYLVLVVVPVFLPLPQQGATILGNLTLFAQFAFWGIWWPFVMLSMMFVGRVWCGWLCPEGFLSEQASRIGLGRTPPRWSGSTVVAVVVGLIWGKGKRVWCRYLCPANGIFGLLSRMAPLHFRADTVAWDRHKAESAPHTEPVVCT